MASVCTGPPMSSSHPDTSRPIAFGAYLLPPLEEGKDFWRVNWGEYQWARLATNYHSEGLIHSSSFSSSRTARVRPETSIRPAAPVTCSGNSQKARASDWMAELARLARLCYKWPELHHFSPYFPVNQSFFSFFLDPADEKVVSFISTPIE